MWGAYYRAKPTRQVCQIRAVVAFSGFWQHYQRDFLDLCVWMRKAAHTLNHHLTE